MTEVTKLSPELETNITNFEEMVFVVQNESDRDGAITAIRTVKTIRQRIMDFFKASKENSYKAWKAVCANEKTFTDRLDSIEKKAKQAIVKHDQFKAEEREKERLRLQAEADEAARRERDRLEKRAANLKTPERKEALIEEAESVIAPVVQLEEQEKTEGVSTRKIWKTRIDNVDEVPREWLIVNEKGLDAFAKSTKGAVKVKGVTFYQESSLTVKL